MLSESIIENLADYIPDHKLEKVVYFTADIKSSDARKRWRQQNYFKLIEAFGHLVVRGDYQIKNVRCPSCDEEPVKCQNCSYEMEVPREKQTDVNIALYSLIGAYQDRYDDLVIVTSDSDQAPVAKQIARWFTNDPKRVYFAFPPCQVQNKALMATCSGWCRISEFMLESCLLPRIVITPEGKKISCPREWLEGGAVR